MVARNPPGPSPCSPRVGRHPGAATRLGECHAGGGVPGKIGGGDPPRAGACRPIAARSATDGASAQPLAIVAVASGCADASSAQRADPPARAVVTDVPEPDDPGPEIFTGAVEDFTSLPDPLPPGRPGGADPRLQEVSEADGHVTRRIMYHSRDAQDRPCRHGDRHVSDRTPAERGWPVISMRTARRGLAGQ